MFRRNGTLNLYIMRGVSKFNDETVNHKFKYITNLLTVWALLTVLFLCLCSSLRAKILQVLGKMVWSGSPVVFPKCFPHALDSCPQATEKDRETQPATSIT